MSGGVDHARSLAGRGGADGGNRLAGDREIAAHDALWGHDVAAAHDEIEHLSPGDAPHGAMLVVTSQPGVARRHRIATMRAR